MTRIAVVDYPEADGRLKEIYDGILDQRGKLAAVHTIQSLRPESIKQHMDLYMGVMFSRSELSRAEREMMAVVVSVANGCEYCQTHHAEALNHYWKNDDKIHLLKQYAADEFLTHREKVLCDYARSLTLEPSLHENADHTKALRDVGLGDQGILDATLVVAYFNFVNRIVLSMGLQVEDDGGRGYTY
ncbi:MAG: peroxidase-related enzyme [Bacteroidales bacterium]